MELKLQKKKELNRQRRLKEKRQREKQKVRFFEGSLKTTKTNKYKFKVRDFRVTFKTDGPTLDSYSSRATHHDLQGPEKRPLEVYGHRCLSPSSPDQ